MKTKNKCSKCNKQLDYHERHYITEKRKENSVWCYNCFKTEIKKLTERTRKTK